MTGNQKWLFPTVFDGTRMNRAFLFRLEAEDVRDEGKLQRSAGFMSIFGNYAALVETFTVFLLQVSLIIFVFIQCIVHFNGAVLAVLRVFGK